MTVGTKSVLWGVHAFWFHPIVVAVAFWKVHRRLPAWWESVAIVTHDLAYWGCEDMDGPSGISHPRGGAFIAAKLCSLFSLERSWDAYFFSLYHSSNFARLHGAKNSDLYLPDKVSILVESKAWYLFRARLSGELKEFVSRENEKQGCNFTDSEWLDYYRQSIQKKLDNHRALLCSKNSTQSCSPY